MLTGLILPTSGNAKIAGFEIKTEISKVHQRIGVCPQFSILWKELTVQQHLEFFARLKGIEDEKNYVKKLMEDFGLYQFKDRMSKKLSGGMKRRLSVAIAVTGDPDVIFLDEPSTGMDPVCVFFFIIISFFFVYLKLNFFFFFFFFHS